MDACGRTALPPYLEDAVHVGVLGRHLAVEEVEVARVLALGALHDEREGHPVHGVGLALVVVVLAPLDIEVLNLVGGRPTGRRSK